MSIYYPNLKEHKTVLGMSYVKNKESYEKHIAGSYLERYDLLTVIEDKMKDTINVINLNYRLSNIRSQLLTLLNGNCTDEEYKKCLSNCYNNSNLFNVYLNYMFFIKSNVNIIKDIITPFVTAVNEYSIEIQTFTEGFYIMTTDGYLYLVNSKYKGEYKYVKIW